MMGPKYLNTISSCSALLKPSSAMAEPTQPVVSLEERNVRHKVTRKSAKESGGGRSLHVRRGRERKASHVWK